MRILGIHHVTLAVRDIEEACETFAALFGADGGERRAIPAFGIRATNVQLGDDIIEFAAPMYPDNPVRRFLERKGEGFYAIAFEVDDIQSAVRELAAKGVRVSEPVESEPGMYSSFVTMTATHGLSVQLVELAGRGETATTAQPAGPARPRTTDAKASGAAARASDAAAGDGAPPPEDSPPPAGAPLDLTPDEWSDTD